MFSRWMPRYHPEQAETPLGSLMIVALTALVLVWYLVTHPLAAAAAAGVGVLILLGRYHSGQQRMRRACDRAGEDIGTFARAFDRRAPTFDPWLVRAVWDALTPWTDLPNGSRFPLRPTDVIADLGCVDEDLDDVIVHAASRACRRLEQTSATSYEGRVVTVGDLVDFLAHQPVAPTA